MSKFGDLIRGKAPEAPAPKPAPAPTPEPVKVEKPAEPAPLKNAAPTLKSLRSKK